MDILMENLSWMVFNVFLALLGVLFGFLFLKAKGVARFFFFILWFLFVPNTIYLVTDLIHFPEQFFEAGVLIQILLVFQYAVVFLLGIATFIIGLYPLDRLLLKLKPWDVRLKTAALIAMNFLIAFAVSLGRAERISSWEVVTRPQQVWQSILNLMTSMESMEEILLFGILINLLYFFSRRLFARFAQF